MRNAIVAGDEEAGATESSPDSCLHGSLFPCQCFRHLNYRLQISGPLIENSTSLFNHGTLTVLRQKFCGDYRRTSITRYSLPVVETLWVNLGDAGT